MASACGGATSSPTSGLTIGFESEPQSLDPRFGTDAASARVMDLVHVALTRPDANARRIGDLATSWQWTDARTIVFHLRADRRFSDGTPVTAADVRATYLAVLDPAVGSPKRGALAALRDVEAPDATTVVMRLATPFPPFVDGTGIGIVPVAHARDPDGVLEGAGPYRVAHVEPGERIELRPNPYHPAPAPALDPIVVRIVPDPVVRTLEMRRGTLGLLQETPEPELLGWLGRQSGVVVRREPGSSYDYLLLNLADRRLATRRVRTAIAHAIDRDLLARVLLGGTVRPASGLLAPEHWAYAPASVPRHDPHRARRLLDRAGLVDPDGPGPRPRFRIVYKTSNQPLRRRLAEAIQAQLADVGIAVDVRPFEWGTLYADVRAGRFEMTSLAWVGVGDPDLYFQTLHSTMTPPAGYNRMRYSSPVMDRLTSRARFEVDPERRRRLYARIQRRAAHDLPVVPLWWEDRVVVQRADLRDFAIDPSGDLHGLAAARIAP